MKKLFGISSMVVGLLVLTGGGFLFYRLSQFRSEIAALKSEGFPVSFADLEVKPEEIENDGANSFNRLATSLASFAKEMYEDPDVLSRPVDEEMIARFNELNEAYPNVFPLLDELAQADGLSYEFHGGDFAPAINEVLERVQQLRSCARVLTWKMRVLAVHNPDEAIAAGIQILQLCRVFDQQPTLLSHLVRIACQGIAVAGIHDLITHHSISDESKDRLNQEIELRAASDDYRISLITERAAGIEYVTQMGIFQMANSGKGYLDVIKEELENCQKAPFEQKFEFEDDYSCLIDGFAAGSLLPALRQLRVASARSTSRLRALRIINELESHPEAVGMEISPSFLVEIGVPEAMTLDTMTGEPMKIHRVDNRWVVYSVGWNLKDDCGDPNPTTGDFVLGVDDDR